MFGSEKPYSQWVKCLCCCMLSSSIFALLFHSYISLVINYITLSRKGIGNSQMRNRNIRWWKMGIILGLKKKLFVSCNPPLTSFYSKKSLPLSFSCPPNSQSTQNMHKTRIFDQKIFFYWPTYPFFFRNVTGNKQFLFLMPYHFLHQSDYYLWFQRYPIPVIYLYCVHLEMV